MKTSIGLSLAVLCSCGPLIATQAELEGVGAVQDPAQVVASAPQPAPQLPPEVVVTVVVPDGGTMEVKVDGGIPLAGLPCNVAPLLVTLCSTCHSGGVNNKNRLLLSRGDFLLPSKVAGLTVAQYAKARLSAGAMAPMPPYGYSQRPTAEETATLVNWLEAGVPGGSCSNVPQK